MIKKLLGLLFLLLIMPLHAMDDKTAGKKKNFYEELGVAQTASLEDIKIAYRKLALKWHPDRNPDPAKKDEFTKRFQVISSAFEVLSDTAKRNEYNRWLAAAARTSLPTSESHRSSATGFGSESKQHKEMPDRSTREHEAWLRECEEWYRKTLAEAQEKARLAQERAKESERWYVNMSRAEEIFRVFMAADRATAGLFRSSPTSFLPASRPYMRQRTGDELTVAGTLLTTVMSTELLFGGKKKK